MTFDTYPIWDLPVGLCPWDYTLYGIYFSFCDRKVLHNVVNSPRLLFDPLCEKYSVK